MFYLITKNCNILIFIQIRDKPLHILNNYNYLVNIKIIFNLALSLQFYRLFMYMINHINFIT